MSLAMQQNDEEHMLIEAARFASSEAQRILTHLPNDQHGFFADFSGATALLENPNDETVTRFAFVMWECKKYADLTGMIPWKQAYREARAAYFAIRAYVSEQEGSAESGAKPRKREISVATDNARFAFENARLELEALRISLVGTNEHVVPEEIYRPIVIHIKACIVMLEDELVSVGLLEDTKKKIGLLDKHAPLVNAAGLALGAISILLSL